MSDDPSVHPTAPLFAVASGLEPVADLVLTSVSGGFAWRDLPASLNVEDRRDWSPARTRRIPRVYLPPVTSPGPRFPGDLPSQLGYDDLEGFFRRNRQRPPQRRRR